MSCFLIDDYEGFSEDFECFVKIENYEDYLISDYGNVWSEKRKKYLKPALYKDSYLHVDLYKNGKRKSHSVHRLVLTSFIANSNDKRCADHVDNVRTNNKLSNLRYASHQENSRNRSFNKNNKLACKGVHFDKTKNKFRAQIHFKGKSHHLGLFNNLEDAKLARYNKAKELFGEFLHVTEKLYN